MKQFLVTIMILIMGLSFMGCTRVQTGEIGIEKDRNGVVSDNPIGVGPHWTIFDTIIVVDATQVRVKAENVKAKDSTGILFEDIDVQATYNVEEQGVVNFYKKTREVDCVQTSEGVPGCDNVLGYALVKQELINAVSKGINKFKSDIVNTDKSQVEAEVKRILTEKLEELYPHAFDVTNININNAQLDKNVERVLQAQALLESEKKLAQIKMDVQDQNSNLLRKELSDMKDMASKSGIALGDLMKYKNEKERNRVLADFSKNSPNMLLQLQEGK